MGIRNIINELVQSISGDSARPSTYRALEGGFTKKMQRAVEDVMTGEDEKPNLPFGGPGTYKLGYRETSTGRVRQLIPTTFQEACEAGERVWRNPLGAWLLNTITSHVVGGGLTYTVEIERTEKEKLEHQEKLDVEKEKKQADLDKKQAEIDKKKGGIAMEAFPSPVAMPGTVPSAVPGAIPGAAPGMLGLLAPKKKVPEIKIEPEVEAANRKLDEFWRENGMDHLIQDLVRFLYVYGIQVIPVFPRFRRQGTGLMGDGQVLVGVIDPRQVTDVITNPVNTRDVRTVTIGTGSEAKSYRLVHKGSDGKWIGLLPPDEGDFWKDEHEIPFDGACFYWRTGNAPFERFGYPLLLKQVDYLDQGDRHFFDIVERVLALQAFVWDVTIKNATSIADLKKQADEQGIGTGPPKSRSVRVHNENVIWQAVSPNLGQSDITQLSRWILLFILGTTGVPLHWFGEGDNTNRASAEAMARPTRKGFEALQDEIKWNVEEMLKYVLDMAVLAKTLPDLKYRVVVQMPQIAVSDTAGDVTALKTCGDALSVALSSNVIQPDQAIKIYQSVADQLGIEIPTPQPPEPVPPQLAGFAGNPAATGAAQIANAAPGIIPGAPPGAVPTEVKVPGVRQPLKTALASAPARWSDATRATETLVDDIDALPGWYRELLSDNSLLTAEKERLDKALEEAEDEGDS
jgi:hypothetical protein